MKTNKNEVSTGIKPGEDKILLISLGLVVSSIAFMGLNAPVLYVAAVVAGIAWMLNVAKANGLKDVFKRKPPRVIAPTVY